MLLKTTCAAALLLAAVPAHADELSDLKAQIRAMRAASQAVEKRLAHLEKEKTARPVLQPVAAPAAPFSPGGDKRTPGLVTSSYAGYIDVPGTNTSIKIGGFVKADGIYDVRGGGIGGVVADFRAIPLKGTVASNRAGDFQFTARQTQINFQTITPTQFGDVKTFVDFDFYAGVNGNNFQSNSYSPRLRQAYASAGNVFGGSLLVGQAWSTFMDLDSYAETLDFGGPVGVSFVRQPQIRYTRDIGNGNKLYFSAESPFGEFQGAQTQPVYTGGSAPAGNTIDPIPDFVAKFTHDDTWGHIAFSGVLRYIKANTGGSVFDQSGAAVPNIDEASSNGNGTGIVNGFAGQAGKIGGGFLGGLVLKTTGLDTLNIQAVGGPGIGRYLYGEDDSFGSSASLSSIDPNGIAHSIKLTTAFGAQVGYQHYWNPQLRSNFVGGYVHYINEFPNDPGISEKDGASAHADLIYSPLPNVDLGVEFIYGYLRLDQAPVGANGGALSASYGTASRVLASAKVGF